MPFSISTEEKLQERIKELSCLYDISLVLAKQESLLSGTLKSIDLILKKAWRFSSEAIIELKLDKHYYISEEPRAKTGYQYGEITGFFLVVGFIKVHYPTPEFSEKHFLPEEQKLLEKVASDLSIFYEKVKNKEKEAILELTAQRMTDY